MADIRRAKDLAGELVSKWILEAAGKINSTRELTRMIEEAILEARDEGRTQAGEAGRSYFRGGVITNH